MAVSGPLARSMDDLEMGLQAMSQGSADDPWWAPVPFKLPHSRKKVALIESFPDLPSSTKVKRMLRLAASLLQNED